MSNNCHFSHGLKLFKLPTHSELLAVNFSTIRDIHFDENPFYSKVKLSKKLLSRDTYRLILCLSLKILHFWGKRHEKNYILLNMSEKMFL